MSRASSPSTRRSHPARATIDLGARKQQPIWSAYSDVQPRLPRLLLRRRRRPRRTHPVVEVARRRSWWRLGLGRGFCGLNPRSRKRICVGGSGVPPYLRWSRIHMFHGMPALLSRQVKVTNLGYDWRKIQRKKVSGQKRIFIRRQPVDQRLRNQCKSCGDRVRARCDYCSPSCKVVHKPNGQNADLIQDLVNMDFTEEPIRDFFCLGCLRAFASAHCTNHNHHIHGADVEEGADLVQITELDRWKLITEDVIGQPIHFERLKRITENGVQMVAVCRRHVPHTQGANTCANVHCHESVDQAGDICSLECLFDIHFPANEEEGGG